MFEIGGIDIPIDGIAISIAVFLLSPTETRLRNTLIVGVIHGILHPVEERWAVQADNKLTVSGSNIVVV